MEETFWVRNYDWKKNKSTILDSGSVVTTSVVKKKLYNSQRHTNKLPIKISETKKDL